MKQMHSSSRIVQQFRAEQPYRIAKVEGALEISQPKILLPKEEAAADALVAGVVDLIPGLDRAGFNRLLRIQQTNIANGLGRVTLVLTYDNELPAEVSIAQVSKAMQALASQGLVTSFKQRELPQQLPLISTGAELEPRDSSSVVDVDSSASGSLELGTACDAAFERACATTKNHFSSKLGGQSLEARVRVESVEGNYVDIAGTVVKPQRQHSGRRTDDIVGVLNVVSKDPPEIKVIGVIGGGTKRTFTVTYAYSPQNVQALTKELGDTSAPQLVFSVMCNTETTPGRDPSTTYTLVSYRLSNSRGQSQTSIAFQCA